MNTLIRYTAIVLCVTNLVWGLLMIIYLPQVEDAYRRTMVGSFSALGSSIDAESEIMSVDVNKLHSLRQLLESEIVRSMKAQHIVAIFFICNSLFMMMLLWANKSTQIVERIAEGR